MKAVAGVVVMMAVIALVAGCGNETPSADETVAANPSDEEHEHILTPVMDDDGKTIKYWTCVMHPSVQMQEPGACPVCKMDLIPVYEGAGLQLTTAQKALIPVRTEPVAFRKLWREIRTIGTLDYNETNLAYASTRISGWIEHLHVDFTGINVRAGDELLTIYSPELVAAQEEYLAALRAVQELKGSRLPDLARTVEQTMMAARSKLELLGLTDQQVDRIREAGAVRTQLPIYAPIGGTVIHLNVSKGQHVNRGTNLFRIADLSSLWILADVYEFELPWLYNGQEVEITSDSMPGRSFVGKVTYIFPFFDAPTRTQKVKIEVDNSDGRLRPGMYVNIRLKPTLAEIYAREAHPLEPYACPMHPWITSKTPGECAICGMALEPTGFVAEASTDDEPTETVWTCPMHPEEIADGPGVCSICGMDLIEVVVPHDHAELFAPPDMAEPLRADHPPLIFKYACPDHPDQFSTAPGVCPMDGRPLVMTGATLSVPKSAVIDTGLRKVVYVDRGDSGYEQIEVELGPEAWAETGSNGQTVQRRYFPVVSGLNPDDMVVTNGNFLLDSQTQLTGAASGAFGGAIGGEASESESAPIHRH